MSGPGSRIFMDGIELRGVTGYCLEFKMKESKPTLLTLTMMAESVHVTGEGAVSIQTK